MKSILSILSELFQRAALNAFTELEQIPDIIIDVEKSTQEAFGHYQCNAAMKLAKILQKNPRQVAQGILTAATTLAQEQLDFIASLEIAGPGFINIKIDARFLEKQLISILHDNRLGIPLPMKKERIIVDFSSPNTAKEMHVGHLRSTIIGDCLARLFEFLGHDVMRLNHIGDWGTAFGMLIAYLKEYKPDILNGSESTDLGHLVAWYKAAKQKFDADETFKKRSQLEVVALQSGNPESLHAWNIICNISEQAYQQIYDLLGVKIIKRGESFYNSMLADVVKELTTKGLVTISDGATCIFLDGFYTAEKTPLPLIIKKSDGGYNYATTDMAAIKHRIQEEKANRIIYVTDSGQSLHFQMIFKAAEKAHYLDSHKIRVDHVGFGLVLGSDGKKFKTRSGDTERLIDLLTAAVEHATLLLLEKNPVMAKEERTALAHALGIAAVKYADLSSNRLHDYVFSYERMLKFDGNTAAFIMYSYVRAESIKRKVGIPIETVIANAHITLEHSSEIALAMHLVQFIECLELVSRDLFPNRLTDYLFTLAEKFNAFFRDCRVEGSEQQESRLLLCELTARTLQQGLSILGISTVEKM